MFDVRAGGDEKQNINFAWSNRITVVGLHISVLAMISFGPVHETKINVDVPF